MNLADHFEPFDPPPDGLRSVRRKAKRRAIAHRLSRGGGLLVFLLVVGIAQMVTNGPPSESDNVEYSTGARDSTAVAPEADRVPSPSSTEGVADAAARHESTWLWSSLLLIGVLVLVVTLLASAFTQSHALRVSRRERIAYAAGALLIVISIIGRWSPI